MKLNLLRPTVPMARSPVQMAPRASGTNRMRGRAGVERRRRFLDQHPICCECQKVGRVSAAVIADHKLPLWAGGADDLDKNGNPLCRAHSDAKTACEATMRAAGGWLAAPCTCGQHADA